MSNIEEIKRLEHRYHLFERMLKRLNISPHKRWQIIAYTVNKSAWKMK
jgi:hypothetical protein